MLAGSNVSRLIARSGFDWVVVDTEHGNLDGSRCYAATRRISASPQRNV